MTLTRLLIYLAFLGGCTLLILALFRHSFRHRFNRAFPRGAGGPWAPEDEAFLDCVEKAYGLARGAAHRLPADCTPMALYLVLYPEHCIYDDRENETFLLALKRVIGAPRGQEDFLTMPLRTLADRWRAATVRAQD